MKRVNIYINKEEEDNLNYLSQVFNNKPRAEIVREAIDEYIKNKIPEIEDFYKGLSAEINDDLNVENEKFLNDCRKDPFLLAESCLKINYIDGLITPILFDYQKIVLEEIHNRNQIIINKARQMGITTTMCIYIVNELVINKNKNFLIIANNQSQGHQIIQTIREMINTLPEFILNKNNITTNFKSRIQVNGNTVFSHVLIHNDFETKGFPILDLIYFDEIWSNRVVFDNNVQVNSKGNIILKPLLNSINDKTKVVIASTGNGYNHFYKLWHDALCCYNNLYPIQLPWNLNKNLDDKWKEQQINMLGKDRFEQDFCCKFFDNNKFKHIYSAE